MKPTLDSLIISAALAVAGLILTVSAQEVAIHGADSLPASTPWNLEALSKAPEFQWSGAGEVRPLFYRGEPYEGTPTRVFAYYATPGTLAGDPTKDKNLPGIVLVHGGGGKAFAKWASLWASRGYAAIAMDLSGSGPDGKRLADGGPDQGDGSKFRTDAPATDQWTYHSVGAVIRAQSLLISFPEVDPQRTAITGISWGGYLTCIVAGLDDRFKAAVPVYGCGFLYENSCWLNRFGQMSVEDRANWVRLWDPSVYVGSATMPMLFVNGGRDFAYPPDSHAKTYALVKSPKNLHFVPDLPHGHIFDKPSAIETFIRQNLEGGVPLARIAEPQVAGDQITADVEARTKLVKAELHHTLDPIPGTPGTRRWISQPAVIADGQIRSGLPPANTTVWFVTVEDERHTTVSSQLVFSKKGGK
jgi:dienelactone hydrolase